MKIVRAKSHKTADVFFNTIKLAQKVAGFEQSFHLMKDYGTHHIENQMKEDESRFFFQTLQAGHCRKEQCSCQEYMQSSTDIKCQRCFHLHKQITQYADLEGMPCVLLLVGKGRMGDTFPNCFNCLDLRVSSDRTVKRKPDPCLSSLVQMLGRMCRYVKASPPSTSTVPYALLGWRLCDELRRSTRESPAFSTTVDCLVDRYESPSIYRHPVSKRWCHNEAAVISYDRANHQKHTNRLMLHAEPQIGKTGAYLYLLKLLRQDITKTTKNRSNSIRYEVHPHRVKNNITEDSIGGRQFAGSAGQENSNRSNIKADNGELQQDEISCGMMKVPSGNLPHMTQHGKLRKVLNPCSKSKYPCRKTKEIINFAQKSPQASQKVSNAETPTKVSECFLFERKYRDAVGEEKVSAAEKCLGTSQRTVTKEVGRPEARPRMTDNKEKGTPERMSTKLGISQRQDIRGSSVNTGEDGEDDHWSFKKRDKKSIAAEKPTRQTKGLAKKLEKCETLQQEERKQRQKVPPIRKEKCSKSHRRGQPRMKANKKGSEVNFKRSVKNRPSPTQDNGDDESDYWSFRRRKKDVNISSDRSIRARSTIKDKHPITTESTPRKRHHGKEQKQVAPVAKRRALNGSEEARHTSEGPHIDQTLLEKARRVLCLGRSGSFKNSHREEELLRRSEWPRKQAKDARVSEYLPVKRKVAEAADQVMRSKKNARLVPETIDSNESYLEKRSITNVSEWTANTKALMKHGVKHQGSLDSAKTSDSKMSQVEEMRVTHRTGLGMDAARRQDHPLTVAHQARGTSRTQLKKMRTGEHAVKGKVTSTQTKAPCQMDDRVSTTFKELLDGPLVSSSELRTRNETVNVHGEVQRGGRAKQQKLSAINKGSEAAKDTCISRARKRMHLQETRHEKSTRIKQKGAMSQLSDQPNTNGSGHSQLEEDDEVLLDNWEDSEDSGGEENAKESTERNWRYPTWRRMKGSESILCKPVRKGSTRTVNGQIYTHGAEETPFLLYDYWSPKLQIHDHRTPVSLQSQLPELVEPRHCRAWHGGHASHCVSCRSWFGKLEDPLELSLLVPLGDEHVSVRLSIPTIAPYADVYRKLKCNGLPTRRGDLYNRNRPGVKYWVFHPSHQEPQGCLLNYRHVLGKEQASCIQAVVVQREHFHSYQRQWGRSHMIIQLPSCSHDVADGVCNLGCPDWSFEGGIGYARRFIQLFSFALKMEYVFILDDNIMFMAEAEFPSRSAGPLRKEGSGVLVMKRCPFTRPFKLMKELVQGQLAPPVKDFEPYPFECITKSSQTKRYPMYSYTGPAKDIDSAPDKGYALMGMLGHYPKVRHPFSRAHVSGAVLLNVKATVENDVFYRPWPCWDEVRFSDDCDLNRLWVVRFNRFMFGKVLNRGCVDVDQVPSIFEWTEETELKYPNMRRTNSSEEAEVDRLLAHVRQQIQSDLENDSWRRFCRHSSSKQGTSDEHSLLTEIYQKIAVPDCSDFHRVTSLCLTYSPQKAVTKSWEMFADIIKKVRKRVLCVMSSADALNVGMTSLQAIRDNRYVCDTARHRKPRVCVYSAFNPCAAASRLLLIDITFEDDSLSPQQCDTSLTEENDEALLTRQTAFEYLQNLLRH